MAPLIPLDPRGLAAFLQVLVQTPAGWEQSSPVGTQISNTLSSVSDELLFFLPVSGFFHAAPPEPCHQFSGSHLPIASALGGA